MFEIGTALREARERQGLTFSQIEEGTKIRARYIRALEDEAFGVLPGTTYTKGFLRAYADYLGLDGHLFIDEFNSRYHDPRNEDDGAIYPKTNSRPRGRQQRRDTNIVLIVLAAIVVIASMVFLGFNSAGPANVPIPPPTSSSTTSTGGGSTGQSTSTTKKQTHHAAQAAKYRIEITAANGDSWLAAHLGSAAGPAAVTVHGTDLSQYLLKQGQMAAILARGPIMISLGAPGSVTITIAGHAAQLPAGTRFTITRTGIKRAA
ncbi:MAG: cytoskeleton protein RodZ [Gaiellales bacterium]|jgi:cytoskeletal protein RodZ|nr:cytoskeleton protein RodZ [Gaiellales bacterium]